VNDEILSDIAIEKTTRQVFALPLEVAKVIVRDLPLSRAARATVFVADSGKLYALVLGDGLLLADVQKGLSRAGLVPQAFLPPQADAAYFDRIGREKFAEVFPSRQAASSDDLAYYRTLAPYDPALVQIARIKDGQIRGYDLTGGEWQIAAEYRYTMIATKTD